ncbi:hypothetical protein BSU04_02285 [Caballeronia sordidicola]|uniref:Uncharacterized protein n=1 Tax=Caballeronia sordidicola TaxID=196367 RepID=A0A226XAG1_CABSO|nr:hypothetical protein BSU04_02285 [Caballeronia sordidicola]
MFSSSKTMKRRKKARQAMLAGLSKRVENLKNLGRVIRQT